jgi:hypothetical protein
MDDVPEFEIDPLQKFRTAHVPPRHLLATLLGADTRESSLAPAADVTAAETASGLLKQLTASLTGVELIDLKSTLCDSRNFCRYKVGEQMLFSDKNHPLRKNRESYDHPLPSRSSHEIAAVP